MKHWIFSTSLSNYKICEKYNVFGVDERYRITAQNHINPGDLMFFYVKKSEQKKQVLKESIFIGPWRIRRAGTYDPNHPAVKEWSPPDTYVYIISIEPIKLKVNELLFLTNRKRKGRGGGYSDHFQFSVISIREEDYNTILKTSRELNIYNFI